MAKAFILIRKSDNRVVGVNKIAINPAPAAPREEFFEDIPPASWQLFRIDRTGIDTYSIGVKKKTDRVNNFETDVDADIDGAASLADLKTAIKPLLKRLRVN